MTCDQYPKNFTRWGYALNEWDCTRNDNENLVNEYLNKSNLEGFEGARVKVVKNRGELNDLNIDETDYLLGKILFNHFVHS